MHRILFVTLLFFVSFAGAKSINIYLKYDDIELRSAIVAYNQFLASKGVFEKYNIRPLIEKFPLHTSLYLTDFKVDNLPKVIKKLKAFTTKIKPFIIDSSHIFATTGGYVMLDVGLPGKSNGKNHTLQQLADKTVLTFYSLHDRDAPIPDWAKNMPAKLAAFERYGSPNVFFEFNPHFTLMAKRFNSEKKSKAFQKDISTLTKLYTEKFGKMNYTLQVSAIGIGEVDEYGQITHELVSIPIQHVGVIL